MSFPLRKTEFIEVACFILGNIERIANDHEIVIIEEWKIHLEKEHI